MSRTRILTLCAAVVLLIGMLLRLRGAPPDTIAMQPIGTPADTLGGFSGGFNPDGSVFAYHGTSPVSQVVYFMDADGTPLGQFEAPHMLQGVSWFADGRRVLVVSLDRVAILAFPALTEQQAIDLPSEPDRWTIWNVALSPDQATLAIGASRGQRAQVVLVDLASGAQTILPINDQRVRVSAFDPTGTRMLLSTSSGDSCSRLTIGGVQFWTLDGQLDAQPLPMSTSAVFSPDGRWLALGGMTHRCEMGDYTLALIDRTTGATVLERQGTGRMIGFTPDSRLLVTLGRDHLMVWDPATADLRHIYALPQAAAETSRFHLTPDSLRVITLTDGTFYTGVVPLP